MNYTKTYCLFRLIPLHLVVAVPVDHYILYVDTWVQYLVQCRGVLVYNVQVVELPISAGVVQKQSNPHPRTNLAVLARLLIMILNIIK